jgi:hypothetical protein
MGPCNKLGSGKSPGPICRNAGPVTGKSSSWACLMFRCEGLRHVCGAHASLLKKIGQYNTVIHMVIVVTNRTGRAFMSGISLKSPTNSMFFFSCSNNIVCPFFLCSPLVLKNCFTVYCQTFKWHMLFFLKKLRKQLV